MAKKNKPDNTNLIAQNKKARHDYEILETFECGLVLTGSEVKSLREKKASINECYAQFDRNNELYLINSHVSHYKNAGYAQHEETRSRKLLMHRLELDRIALKKDQQSLTLVPLKLYWKDGRVKVEIALGRGRKKHDKRQVGKDNDWKRQQSRLLKG
ncbi:MAG: SsrA-binding protein [Alphaproteobacteria bacterium]|jgi:SsrA-binding protein